MKRPEAKTLWRLAVAVLILAVCDIVLTSIGILFFYGQEGNPLIVALAGLFPGASPHTNVVLAVWLSKMFVIALVLIAVHAAVKSLPERDDKLMFVGLLSSLLVYIGDIASWGWYFFQVLA